jgi:hypothetical protein
MRHSNQIGILWQVEISAMSKTVLNQGLTFQKVFMLKRRARNDRRKKEVRITTMLFGFSKALAGIIVRRISPGKVSS